MSRAYWASSLALIALACSRDAGTPSESARPSPPSTAQTARPLCEDIPPRTLEVMQALTPVCAGCHLVGTRGYFASAEAFQSLLVADPRLVQRGDPDGSELIRLIEGRGTGAFRQMPIGTTDYPALLASGQATLSIEDLRAWVRELPAPMRSASPDGRAPRITRLSATQIQRSLYQQLGLSEADFFTPAGEYGIAMAEARGGDEPYPLQPVDAIPMPRQRTTADRFHALGGGSTLRQVRADNDVGPTFVLTLMQVSQRWCRMGLAKTTNEALFPAGTTRVTDEANVRSTIRRWSLHFHARHAEDAEVDALYDLVWRPVSTGEVEAGWVALCSTFIRHPDWIFY